MAVREEMAEQRILIRGIRIEDYDAIRAMALRCFPGMHPWEKDQIESQLAIFPEGQLCVEFDGRVVASSNNLIVDFDDYDDWQNWKEIADSGYIRNHDPAGDTLYGIEIMVDPEFRGMRLARRLYDARKELCRQQNLHSIIIGGRIPGYGKHAEKMSAREYVERVVRKELTDPVLTVQLSNGFTLRSLIPNYFPADEASRGYATFLEWINLDHVKDRPRRYRAVSPVRLSLVQYGMRSIDDFEDFATQCEFFVDTASESAADFLVFPELITTQLLSTIRDLRPGLAARKLAEYTPRYVELFTRLAMKYSVNIIGGSQFVVENDRLFNVSFLFQRDGSIGRQYKLHITPAERKWWGVSPGNKVEVFNTDRGKVAILICYDIEFPELARVATALGARIIFVPFNTDERFAYLRVRHCAQARAIENEVYVATAGCTGNLPFVDNADVHYAQSGIYTPSDFAFARDAIAAESGENVETMVVNDVDLEALRRLRADGSVTMWKDRRSDLYKVHYTAGDGTELHV
ncbi:MAG: GNAT family N-acetyltransferase [Phycisphaerales bacterium]|nr:GNAT family N-acetyltransferase [Phycisphaerales bacterium]MCB9862311.1 GNAT family N-acetyltransferase [Phycisphaerales bacterium]